MLHCNRVIAFFIMYNLGLGYSLYLSRLNVPPVADLQDDVTIDCAYDMGGEELYSVKWYKDEEEFFRYVPSGGGTLSFPVLGVHPREGNNGTHCNGRHCSVTLTQLSRQSAGAYRCEVSTEAPAFRVAFDTANMSIVAFPRGKLLVSTLKSEYSEGEEIRVNCTSPPSDPPPSVRWLVNDVEMNPEHIISQSDSPPDERGLITRSLAAHLTATKELFLKNNGLLSLKCEVKAYTQKPLHASVYMSLLELRTQNFDWLSSSDSIFSNSAESQVFMSVVLFLALFLHVLH